MTMITPASRKRHQKGFGFGADSESPLGGGFFGAQPGPWSSVIPELTWNRPQERLERLPVGLQRGDRDPLLGAVMTGPDRAELDRRHTHPQEGDRVGGAVAPDAHRLAVMVLGSRRAQRPDEGRLAIDRS